MVLVGCLKCDRDVDLCFRRLSIMTESISRIHTKIVTRDALYVLKCR